MTNLAIACSQLGKVEEAVQALNEVLALALNITQLDLWEAMFGIAGLQLQAGELSASLDTSQKLIQQIEHLPNRPTWLLGLTSVIIGQILHERNEEEQALAFLQSGITHLRNTVEQVILAFGYATLAKVYQAMGNDTLALEILVNVEDWLTEVNVEDLGFRNVVDFARANIWIQQNRIDHLAEWIKAFQPKNKEELTYPEAWKQITIARAYLALEQIPNKMMA